jgi:hypothetical protein
MVIQCKNEFVTGLFFHKNNLGHSTCHRDPEAPEVAEVGAGFFSRFRACECEAKKSAKAKEKERIRAISSLSA